MSFGPPRTPAERAARKSFGNRTAIAPVRARNAVRNATAVLNRSAPGDARKEREKAEKEKELKEKLKTEKEKLDEIYRTNLEMVYSLLGTVPQTKARCVRTWLALIGDSKTFTKPEDRNLYVAYLLFQMQNFNIVEPFNEMPPKKMIVDSTKFMIPAKFNTLMEEANKVLEERKKQRIPLTLMGNFRRDFKPPYDFLEDHPSPHNGIVCYGGCFSNHFVE